MEGVYGRGHRASGSGICVAAERSWRRIHLSGCQRASGARIRGAPGSMWAADSFAEAQVQKSGPVPVPSDRRRAMGRALRQTFVTGDCCDSPASVASQRRLSFPMLPISFSVVRARVRRPAGVCLDRKASTTDGFTSGRIEPNQDHFFQNLTGRCVRRQVRPPSSGALRSASNTGRPTAIS
jgi:hypothetical protein